jgi:hypothetical protein
MKFECVKWNYKYHGRSQCLLGHSHSSFTTVMPTIAVPGQGVQFFYTDTGPPLDAVEYPTLILVHGHTYHSGKIKLPADLQNQLCAAEVFKRMLPLAASRSVRIICINRREYPGSTPYTAVELQVYASGSREERAMLWHREGLTLALGIDKIIEQCELPAAVTLIGWSLGNTFILAARVSIASISPESQERLRSSIKWFIMWGTYAIQEICRLNCNLDISARPSLTGTWH